MMPMTIVSFGAVIAALSLWFDLVYAVNLPQTDELRARRYLFLLPFAAVGRRLRVVSAALRGG